MSDRFMLRKFRIENYKILELAEFDFRNMNIIIGPNGAGKTSLFEALSLLGMLANGWEDTFLDYQLGGRARKGFPQIVSQFDANRRIKLCLQLIDKTDDHERVWDYEVSFGYQEPNAYTASESLKLDGEAIFELIELKGLSNKVYRLKSRDIIELGAQQLGRYPLLLSKVTRQWFANEWKLSLVKDLGDALARWSFYRFDIRNLWKDYEELSLDTPERLRLNGSNLPKILFMWKETRPLFSKYRRVYDLFKVALYYSGFDEQTTDLALELDVASKLLYVRLYFYEGTHYIDLAFGPEGWKAMLLLTAALVQDDTGLIFIEEPETHIYPKFMELVAEEVKTATKRGVQVLFTSHSTSLVNFFGPEDLILIEKGKPRRTAVGKRLQEVAISLGDAWLLDLLED